MIRLVVLNTELKGVEIESDRDDVTIGRATGSDIVLEQASVSRAHARIRRENDRYVIADLGSKNGIKIAGESVEQGELTPDGIFAIGDVEIRFQTSASEAEVPPDAVTMVAPGQADASAQAPAPGSLTDDQTSGTAAGVPAPVASAPVARPLTGEDLAVPGGTPTAPGAQPGAGEPAAPPGAEPSYTFAYALLGMLVVAAVVLLVVQLKGTREPVQRLTDALMIKIGQERLWRPTRAFTADSVRSEDDGIATAKAWGRYVVLKGLSSGSVNVTASGKKGGRIRVRVIVRGRRASLDAEWAHRPLTGEQRLKLARFLVAKGDHILREQPYEAMINYRRARMILEKGFDLTPSQYNDAKDREKAAENEVERQWEKHRQAFNFARQNNDISKAVEELRMLQDVIPDPDDIRRQKVEYMLQRYAPEIARKRRP